MVETVSEPGPTAVTYVGLPIASGGAHRLGHTGFREAYRRTCDFIDACAVVVLPRQQEFSFQYVPELPDLPVWEPVFRERFGGGAERTIPIADSQVDDALAFLDEVNPQPQNQWGLAPLWFTTLWRIQIVDPATGEPFPGQEPSRYSDVEYEWKVRLGESRVRLNLSNRVSLGIELCLPDIDDVRLREVLPAIQAHAPFRFSSKSWRRWEPTKTGSFRARKIDPLR